MRFNRFDSGGCGEEMMDDGVDLDMMLNQDGGCGCSGKKKMEVDGKKKKVKRSKRKSKKRSRKRSKRSKRVRRRSSRK